MAKQRVLTTRKAGIAALLALLLAAALFCGWVLLLLPLGSILAPSTSPSVTKPVPASPSPSVIPTQGITQPSPGPLGADARVDVPQQG